jgi:hypothetical protein
MFGLIRSLLDQLGFQTDDTPEPFDDDDWAIRQGDMQHTIEIILRDPSIFAAVRHQVSAVGNGIMMNLQLIRWQQSPLLVHLHALLDRIDAFVDAFASCASAGIIAYWPFASCVLLSQPAVILFKVSCSQSDAADG